MFLLTVVLLLHLSAEGSSEPAPISYEEFISNFMWYMNALRSSVAYGMVVSNYWGKVNQPTSANMFMLEYSPEMEVYAAINVQGCQSSNFIPPGGSLNFGVMHLSKGASSANAIDSLSTTNNHLSRVMPQDYNYTKLDTDRLEDIANDWLTPLNHNLTDSQGQVIYNNRNLESLANIQMDSR
ncbi:unnamed protein product [Haemonchus placei]|uniref:SCP domain-containing protein n=1 Tax=Haemonchus placei TaxID=6290 RepID=A0A0N4WGX2_HAEPC|nr:unnamed protein product [Haemonchus placei]